MEPPALVRMSYVSEPTFDGDDAAAYSAVRAILARSKARNLGRGIGGVLLYNGFRFAQVLEGPREAVDRLYRRIRDDPRHRNVVLLDWRPVAQLRFDRAGMNFVGPDRAPWSDILDYDLSQSHRTQLCQDRMYALLTDLVRRRTRSNGSGPAMDIALAV